MARTDFVQAERHPLTPDQRHQALEQKRAEREAAEALREETADNVAVGILGEAMSRGFAVNDDTREALSQQPAPEPEQPAATAEAPPSAVDEIIANLHQDVNEKVTEVEEEDDEPEVQMPDFEAEAEQILLDEELAAAEEGYEPEYEEEEGPYNPADRKRAIIAEKKAAFYENLTATREKAKWEKEALKHFPLSKHALGDIKAKSRRGYLKAAKEAHEAVKPYVQAYSQSEIDKYKQMQAEAKAEAEANAAAAYGTPTAGPGAAPTNYSDREARVAAARGKDDLAAVIFEGMFTGGDDE